MNASQYVLLLVLVAMSSCVTRVDPPQEGLAQLHIELEMMRNQELVATLNTSNTLSGVYPIEQPHNAIIQITDPEVDEDLTFTWDEDRKVYTYPWATSSHLFSANRKINLKAFLEESNIEEIESSTRVPAFAAVENQENFDVELVTDKSNGENYWERTYKFNTVDMFLGRAAFYQLYFEEQLATLSNEGEYIKYTPLNTKLEIVEILQGGEAIREFTNKKGVFIKTENLESDFLEFRLRSSEPIPSDDVVTMYIETNIISITEEQYEYDRGLHNIKQSQNSIFGESALYRSNIERGLGIFSACVVKEDVFYLN